MRRAGCREQQGVVLIGKWDATGEGGSETGSWFQELGGGAEKTRWW